MYVIKIKTATTNNTYLNLEAISYFYFNPDINSTFIKMKTGELFDVNGDVCGKLAKLISISTSGNILNME